MIAKGARLKNAATTALIADVTLGAAHLGSTLTLITITSIHTEGGKDAAVLGLGTKQRHQSTLTDTKTLPVTMNVIGTDPTNMVLDPVIVLIRVMEINA